MRLFSRRERWSLFVDRWIFRLALFALAVICYFYAMGLEMRDR
jgi:hypothetical protein